MNKKNLGGKLQTQGKRVGRGHPNPNINDVKPGEISQSYSQAARVANGRC